MKPKLPPGPGRHDVALVQAEPLNSLASHFISSMERLKSAAL